MEIERFWACRVLAVMREFWDLCVDGGGYAWEIGFMRESADLCVFAGVYACLEGFMRDSGRAAGFLLFYRGVGLR